MNLYIVHTSSFIPNQTIFLTKTVNLFTGNSLYMYFEIFMSFYTISSSVGLVPYLKKMIYITFDKKENVVML